MQILEFEENVWMDVFGPKSNKNTGKLEKETQRAQLNCAFKDYAKVHEELCSIGQLKSKLDAKSLGVSYLRRY